MRSFGNNKFSSENICKQDQRVFVVPQRLYNLFWIDSMCLQKKKSPLKQTSDKTNSRQHRNISGSFIFGSPSPLPCRKSILSYFYKGNNAWHKLYNLCLIIYNNGTNINNLSLNGFCPENYIILHQ